MKPKTMAIIINMSLSSFVEHLSASAWVCQSTTLAQIEMSQLPHELP